VISYPAPLLATGGSRTGVAQVNLLDIQDTNGNLYFFSDRPSNAPVAITGANRPSLIRRLRPLRGKSLHGPIQHRGGHSGASAGNTSQMSVNGTVNALLSKQSDTEVDTYDQEIIWSDSLSLPSRRYRDREDVLCGYLLRRGTGGSFSAPVIPPSPATVVGWNGKPLPRGP